MAIKNPAPYRKIQLPYTRKSRVRGKAYIKTIPPNLIVKFVMGNSQKWYSNGYKFRVEVISEKDCQIRDAALEASRQQFLRGINEDIGLDFYFSVSAYPHHVLREHKQAAVAQADRMSSGMKLSFGRTVGRAAQIHKGKAIFTFGVNTENDTSKLRTIYKRVRPKLPIRTRFEITKI